MRDCHDRRHRRFLSQLFGRYECPTSPFGGAVQSHALADIVGFLAQRIARQDQAGKKIEDMGLFGAKVVLSGGGVCNARPPRSPRCLMASHIAVLYALFLSLQKAAVSSAIARGLRENLYSLAIVVNASLRRQALGAIG